MSSVSLVNGLDVVTLKDFIVANDPTLQAFGFSYDDTIKSIR